MRWLGTLLIVGLLIADARAAADALPRYDLHLTIDTTLHRADFRMTVTWTNHHARPTNEIAFNFYPQYRIPDGDHLLLAKTLELLRLNPSDGIDRAGRHGSIDRVTLAGGESKLLGYHYRHDNPSAVVVELPTTVNAGETVTLQIEGTIRLPNKQGRWGHWQGVHFVSNALPVVAFYDELGWHAMPFIPWHQPFWNEAGQYTATIRVPADQKVACSAGVKEERVAADGWKEVVTQPFVGRDFAVLASARYQEWANTIRLPSGREVTLKCLAFPEHEHYAKEILKIVGEAIPVYSEWFGDFPYPQFTIAESFFGWNGNECSGLVMIDERVFGMPHLARGYVEYLVSHETCHQWWYNLVGTNGYAETFMDEGAATYFTHRLLDKKHGKNNAFMNWPDGLTWLPNINRENYRNASMYGAIRKDQMRSAAGELPGFDHLVGLFTGAYDRGSRVFGMIEAQLGETAFLDFTRDVVQKYSWRVLSAQQFKTELEAYTGRSQDEFFERWVYGKGVTDWQVESVSGGRSVFDRVVTGAKPGPRRMEIIVSQTGDYNEPTTLGIQFADGDGFPLRIPISATAATVRVAEQDVLIQPLPDNKVRVELTLPNEPSQICIDPDRVLIDRNPANNVWRQKPRFTLSPLYSMLNETDLTNDYDKWNFGAGPWIGGALYPDPWYMRSTMLGVRAGAYRTQIYSGGVYAAYRTDFRDVVVGADGLWDHWPLPKTQLGFNVEQRVGGPYGDTNGRDTATRASAFARYVWQYGSSLYLPPLAYSEVFTTYQDNFLPFARTNPTGAQRPDYTYVGGLHTRVNLYTPYWDPECGFWFDATAGSGAARLDGKTVTHHQMRLELAAVRKLLDSDCLGRLGQSRLAVRVVAQGAFPDRGQFFALGGGTLFRGYDLAERQGSLLWVANAELRVPLARNVTWDVLDHVAGARNVWLAGFYDVGGVYSKGRIVGDVAHAAGVGLRVDTALFSFIERVTFRFDVAKTINDNTPVQFWFGVQHAF